MFGKRYFGGRYFGRRFFGTGGEGAPPEVLQVIYVSHSMNTYAGRAEDIYVDAPVGIQEGDGLLLLVIAGASGAGPSPLDLPAGFDLLSDSPWRVIQADGGFSVDMYAAYKVATDSEPVEYVVVDSLDHASASQAMVVAVRNQSGPPAIAHNFYEPYSSTGADPGNRAIVTTLPVTANGLALFAAHNWNLYTSGSTPTAAGGQPPSYTERQNSGGTLIYLATGEITADGNTGDVTQAANDNAGGDPWQALNIVFEPAEGAEPPTFATVVLNLANWVFQ